MAITVRESHRRSLYVLSCFGQEAVRNSLTGLEPWDSSLHAGGRLARKVFATRGVVDARVAALVASLRYWLEWLSLAWGSDRVLPDYGANAVDSSLAAPRFLDDFVQDRVRWLSWMLQHPAVREHY